MRSFMSFKLYILELCSTFGVIKGRKSVHKSGLFASLGVTSSNGTGLWVQNCWGIYFIQGNKHSLLLGGEWILIHNNTHSCARLTVTSPILLALQHLWLSVCDFSILPVWLHADHPAKGGVAGVQLGSRCRWTLHLHSGGTWTESLLQRRQRPSASPAPGESRHNHTSVNCFSAETTSQTDCVFISLI